MIDTEILEIYIRAKNEAEADFAETQAEIDAVGDHASMMGAGLHTMGIGLIAAGAAAAAAIGYSVDAATEFQTNIVALAHGAGESVSNLGMVSQGILKMAGDVGVSANDLSKAMYMVESAGYHGAAGLQVLQASAMGAKIGMASQATVADALTTVLNDYHLPASAAAAVTGQMVAAVAAGKMHFEDLASSISKFIPIASQLHIPFQQAAAALSVMTANGVPAARAATAIQAGIMQLVHPSVTAKDAIAAMGIPLQQLQEKLASGDLYGAMNMFSTAMATKLPAAARDAVAKAQKEFANGMDPSLIFPQLEAQLGPQYSAMISNLVASFGGVRGGALALNLIPNMGQFKADINSIGTPVQGLGKLLTDWGLVNTTLAQQLDKLGDSMGAMAITIGTSLLPVITRIAQQVAPVVQEIGAWIQVHPALARNILLVTVGLGALSAAIMGVGFVVQPLVALLGLVASPIGVIAAAVGVLYEAWTHNWGDIQQKTQAVWAAIKPVFQGIEMGFYTLREAFKVGGLSEAFAVLPTVLNDTIGELKAFGERYGTELVRAFSQINWPNVEAAVTHGLNDVFNTMGSWLQQTGIPFFIGRLADIKSAFEHIDWSKLGGDILGALGNLKDDIAAIDWKGAWSNLKSAFTGVIGWVRSLDWSGWASDAISGVQTALSTVGGWIRSAGNSTLVKNLESWASAFAAWVPGATIAFLKAWPGMLSSIMDQIGAAAGPILLQLGTWGLQFAEWVAPAIPGLLKAALGFSVALTTFILETVGTIAVGLVKWGIEFVQWVAPHVPGMLREAGKLAGSLLSWIGTEASQLGTKLLTWASEFGTWVMTSAWPALHTAAGKLFGQLGTWIGGQAGAIGTDLDKWAHEFGAWVIAKGWPALQNGLAGLGTNLGMWITNTSPPAILIHLAKWSAKFAEWAANDAWPVLKTGATTFLNDFTAWIKGGAGDAILNAAKTWPGKIVSGLLSANAFVLTSAGGLLLKIFEAFDAGAYLLFVSGFDIVQGLINGMVNQTSALLGEVSSLIGVNIRTPFDNAVKWLKDAGTQVVQGLIDGIKSMAGNLKDTVTKHIVDVVKDIPGVSWVIKSPSRLFHGYGQNVVQGLINGLASQHGALDAQMQVLTRQVSGASFQTAIAQLGIRLPASLNSNTSSLPSASLLSGGGAAIGTQNVTVNVNVNGTSVSTSGDAEGIGKYVGEAIVQAFQQLKRSASSSNSISGHLPLGGAV